MLKTKPINTMSAVVRRFAQQAGVLLLASGIGFFAPPALGQEQIRVVGSSTVFPFTALVAEWFVRNSSHPSPVVESTGTGGGFKIICSSSGTTVDINNASRPIKDSELKTCAASGIDLLEVKIGYDGITLSGKRSGKSYQMTRQEIFLALAKLVPQGNKLIPNPYKTWNQINARLPKLPIRVYGPPPSSGTRDAFVELVMEEGAESIPYLKQLKESDPDRYKAAAAGLREDGAFIEAGENDNLIVQKLNADPDAFGIFGFSFYQQNTDALTAIAVEGVVPNFDNIANGSYPVSRPLFFYVNKQQLAKRPDLQDFLREYISDEALGEYGYLADKGLIPLPGAEQEQVFGQVTAFLK